MIKWISLAIVLVAVALYFTGALELENNADSVNISIDKEKTEELGKSLKERLEE